MSTKAQREKELKAEVKAAGGRLPPRLPIELRCFWCHKKLAEARSKRELQGVSIKCPRCGRLAKL